MSLSSSIEEFEWISCLAQYDDLASCHQTKPNKNVFSVHEEPEFKLIFTFYVNGGEVDTISSTSET